MVQKAVTILLPCKVSHDPTVNVTWEWRKNTARLSDSRYTVLADGTLQIVSPQEADTATFSCHVFSNGGNATVSTVLKIVCKFNSFPSLNISFSFFKFFAVQYSILFSNSFAKSFASMFSIGQIN